jgi:N-acetylmuramic acid 6-phosphate etherase
MNDPLDRYQHLSTEQPNPASADLDLLQPLEFVDLMQEEDRKVLEALEGVREDLAELIEILAGRFKRGGRLFYVGAGTSGRLGMLDATECPPTFGVPRDQVQAILAGGFESLVRSVEGAEDHKLAGAKAIRERGVTAEDFVLGIAASSTTPFVQEALHEAHRMGAYTVLLTSHEHAAPGVAVNRLVVLATGPEVLTGSTRLKAGTATKLFLNRLTTGAMIQIGKVYQNRMVDLHLSCEKLRARALRTTRVFTGLSREEALDLLESVGGSVKEAILVHRLNIPPGKARQRLEESGGNLRKALEMREISP